MELGAGERFGCRLVIIRVPKEVGDRRRRHLHEEARRRCRKPHRKNYLALQDWIVFVTNLDEVQASGARPHELYQLRWRIENIFKLSKSHTSLLKVAGHRTNEHHTQLMIWSWLLMMIALGSQGIFRLCGEGGVEVIEASIFKGIGKVLQWVALSIELACEGTMPNLTERLVSQQQYYDRYEKRRRISMPERLANALQPHPLLLLG